MNSAPFNPPPQGGIAFLIMEFCTTKETEAENFCLSKHKSEQNYCKKKEYSDNWANYFFLVSSGGS